MQPLRRDTWAPVGVTQVRYAWQRHDRLNAICALTAAPWAWRAGLYYDLIDHNFHADDVLHFLKCVHHHLRRPLILIWDGWQVHRSVAKRLEAEGCNWLRVAWLPAYAPELDPVEFVWSRAKYADLANWIPDDIQDVKLHVQQLMERYRHDPKCLHAFFQAANLTL